MRRHMNLLRLFLTSLPLIQPLYARSLHPREISHQEIQLITQSVGQRCIKRRRAGTHVLQYGINGRLAISNWLGHTAARGEG